jgi:hypothetical protein
MKISLWNKSVFSARNRAVTVHLKNMFRAKDRAGPSSGWVDVEFWNDHISGTQWDGGAAYILHGFAVRRIPDLILTGLYSILALGPAEIKIRVLADGGYSHDVDIPVKLIIDDRPQYKSSITAIKEWI